MTMCVLVPLSIRRNLTLPYQPCSNGMPRRVEPGNDMFAALHAGGGSTDYTRDSLGANPPPLLQQAGTFLIRQAASNAAGASLPERAGTLFIWQAGPS